MWRKYFKLVRLVPGKVIVQKYGTLDFSGDVPVEICKDLFENDWPNLVITPEGKRELYGIETEPDKKLPQKQVKEKQKRTYKKRKKV